MTKLAQAIIAAQLFKATPKGRKTKIKKDVADFATFTMGMMLAKICEKALGEFERECPTCNGTGTQPIFVDGVREWHTESCKGPCDGLGKVYSGKIMIEVICPNCGAPTGTCTPDDLCPKCHAAQYQFRGRLDSGKEETHD